MVVNFKGNVRRADMGDPLQTNLEITVQRSVTWMHGATPQLDDVDKMQLSLLDL